MTMPVRTVVVGVNDSAGARRALAWAADHCAETAAELVAVHVLTYSHELVADLPPTGLTNWRRTLQARLGGEWTEPARSAGVAVRCVLIEDDSAAAGILAVARRENADLVVLGSNGHGNVADRVLGATAYRVAHRAIAPVVIIPPDWEGSEAA